MKSVWITYIVIIIYYLLGTIGIYFINRRKDPDTQRKAWIKHIMYFIVTNIIFFSIGFNTIIFRVISVVIIAEGFIELYQLFRKSNYNFRNYYFVALLVFAFLAAGFYLFGKMDRGIILFSFLILSIFDGFSQVTGQLLGKRKLFRKISPNKTVEGLIGGAVIAILSALVFRQLIPAAPAKAMMASAVVALFAFAGDAAKSAYKRRFDVKDFARIIPGHGGFLDRFDSLIAGGAGVAIFSLIFPF